MARPMRPLPSSNGCTASNHRGKWGQITISTRLLELARRTPEQQAALLAVAFEGEYWRPTCPSCGVKLMDRKPRSGGQRFWGCANYPRCKYTQPMAQTAAGRRHGER